MSGGIGYILPMLLIFLFTPKILQELGEVKFGIYSIITTLLSYLLVLDFAFEMPVTKEISAQKVLGDSTDLRSLSQESLLIYLILGGIGILICFVFSHSFELLFNVPESNRPMFHSCVKMLGFQYFSVMLLAWNRSICYGHNLYSWPNLIYVANTIIGLLFGYLLLVQGFDLEGLIFGRVLVGLLIGVFVVFKTIKLFKLTYPSLALSNFTKNVIKVNWFRGVMLRFTEQFLNRADQIVIAHFLGLKLLGYYGIAFLISNSLVMFCRKIVEFSLPLFSAAHTLKNTDRVFEIFLNCSQLVFIFSFLVFCPLIVHGNYFLVLWLGMDSSTKVLEFYYVLLWSSYLNIVFIITISYLLIGVGKFGNYTNFLMIKGLMVFLSLFLLIEIVDHNAIPIGLALSAIFDILFFIPTIIKLFNKDQIKIIFKVYFKNLITFVSVIVVFVYLKTFLATMDMLSILVQILLFFSLSTVLVMKTTLFGSFMKVKFLEIFRNLFFNKRSK